MAGFTNYLEDKIMNHLFGDDTGASGADHYTAPTTWYVGLLTAAPSDSAAGTEVSGGAYARQAVVWTISGSGVAQAVNTSAITFPAATTNWGTATHCGIYDAASSGNLVAYETLTAADFSTANPKTINAGDIFKLDSSNLKIQLD